MSKNKAWCWLPFALLLLWQALAITSPWRHVMADVERIAAISASAGLEAVVLSDARHAVDLHDTLPATHHEGCEHDALAARAQRHRLDATASAPATPVTARLQRQYLEVPQRPPRHLV